MGTQNALLRLGKSCYLEVIAIGPHLPAPSRPRWFGLDTPEVQEKLGKRPTLLHYVMRTTSFELPGVVVDAWFGPVTRMARGNLSWEITIPDDGTLPGGGCLPSLIRWPEAAHPAGRLKDQGVCLKELNIHYGSDAVLPAVLPFFSPGTKITATAASQLGLAAELITPSGLVLLT
jgi:hypothetical protein